MSQIVKVIDVTRSYIPIDPKTFPETYHATQGEDTPEERIPVVPYEGYNFLPTSQGYKSYFGDNQTLGINPLPSRCDKVFLIQTQTFDNLLVALCEDGIWTKAGETAGDWDHVVTLTIPAVGQHLDWTYTVIGKELFCYRAQGASYYRFEAAISYAAQPAASGTDVSLLAQFPTTGGVPAGTYSYKLARRITSTGALTLPSTGISVVVAAPASVIITVPTVADTSLYRLYRTLGGVTYYQDVVPGSFEDYDENWTLITLPDTSYQIYTAYTPTTVVPTFLNMAGQQGIFKAGIRLGFWDSENSIAWSSIDDLGEFTPDVETLAGSAIFTDVTGRIATIHDLATGFVVYATKSIVYVAQAVSATFQWNPQVLSSTAGIAFPEQAIKGAEVGEHFAYTSSGLAQIQTSPGSQIAKLEFIVPEVADYLSKTPNPLYLKLLNNRYLCIQTLDADYINAAVGFTNENVEEITYTFPGAGGHIIDIYPEETLDGLDFCVGGGILAGSGDTIEQQEMAVSAHEAAATAEGNPTTPGQPTGNNSSGYPPAASKYEPEWDAELCVHGVPNAADITWIGSPCATVDAHGVERGMCPQAPSIVAPMYGVSGGGQVTITGQKWDLKKIIQVQTALWDWEDNQRSQYITAILARVFEDQYHGGYGGPETGQVANSTECLIGQFLDSNAWHDQGWAANKCSFWMSRTINRAVDIYRRRTSITNYTPGGSGTVPPIIYKCTSTLIWHDGVGWVAGVDPTGADINAVGDNLWAQYMAANPTSTSVHTGNHGTGSTAETADNNCPGMRQLVDAIANGVGSVAHCVAHFVCSNCNDFDSSWQCIVPVTGSIDAYVFARNHGEQVSIPEIKDIAFAKIVGWRYTDIYGTERIIPGITDPECKAPDDPAFTAVGIISGNTPTPEAETGALCGADFPDDVIIPGYSISPLAWPSQSLTFPGGTFLLQHGSIGPIYPTFEGAFVYDLALKKWGKLKGQYRQLLDYTPINTLSDAVITAEDFRVKGGWIKPDGVISIFDEYPADSYLKWGKIGYYRKGMTTCTEVNIHDSTGFVGTIETETSLNGAEPEGLLSTSASFGSGVQLTAYPNSTGRWHNVTVRGTYDIKYLEVRGILAGRR